MTDNQQELPAGRQDETVTVAEAARRLGKSPDAVRSALRRKSLEGYRDNQGDWRIFAASLPTGADGPNGGLSRAIDALRQEIDRLHDELRQARDATEQSRRQAEDRQATVAELRVDLGRAEERVAARDQRIVDLRAQLDREIARADRSWLDRLRELLRR